ncbi:MAG: DUF3316 domain-containing protein [Muribaculaceae bacterium]|nr:DUF3316 domain-containing protein [Muribaculaceae bacterium]MDE6753042.1 DUF3316 domain-containing protein [Muribaculaceae bacterium]
MLIKQIKRLFLSLTVLLIGVLSTAFSVNADNTVIQDDSLSSRPVTGIYSLEIGRTNVLATYLSPLHYTGAHYGATGEWSKALPFNPEKMLMHFDGGIEFCSLLNPAHTARMVGMTGDFRWGMSWRTNIPWNMMLTLGGTVGIDGGAYYLMRNSNNPVQAMASAGLGLRASLARPFRLGKLYFLVRDVVSLPSLSVFFSPQYGETYYEIYLGNHKGLAHAGWWGNNFRIDNRLSLTIDFGRTALTLGYRFKADTQWSDHLNTKIFTHSFMIGVIPGGIGLKPKADKEKLKSIYSLY